MRGSSVMSEPLLRLLCASGNSGANLGPSLLNLMIRLLGSALPEEAGQSRRFCLISRSLPASATFTRMKAASGPASALMLRHGRFAPRTWAVCVQRLWRFWRNPSKPAAAQSRITAQLAVTPELFRIHSGYTAEAERIALSVERSSERPR